MANVMTNEQTRRLALKALSALKRKYGKPGARVARPALEELMMGILTSGMSERRANAALTTLAGSFVDWNEMRIGDVNEIAGRIGEVENAAHLARCIRFVLQRVYDIHNEMSLEFLQDKSSREAVRLVAQIEGFPESAVARATLLSMQHESIPLTPGVVNVCRRLALIEDGNDHRLDKHMPREKLYEFHWLVTRHAQAVCLADEPLCEECVLRVDCRAGRARTPSAKSSAPAGRPHKSGKTSR
jgi:endonuclease III